MNTWQHFPVEFAKRKTYHARKTLLGNEEPLMTPSMNSYCCSIGRNLVVGKFPHEILLDLSGDTQHWLLFNWDFTIDCKVFDKS